MRAVMLSTPTVLGASLHHGRPDTMTVGPVQSTADTRCSRDSFVPHPASVAAQQLRSVSPSFVAGTCWGTRLGYTSERLTRKSMPGAGPEPAWGCPQGVR